MYKQDITFEKLPEAVGFLIEEVKRLSDVIQSLNQSETKARIPIQIGEACKIIGLAKVTVYQYVRKRKIPCYKNGRKLYFFEEELVKWVEDGERATLEKSKADVQSMLNSGIKRKPRSRSHH